MTARSLITTGAALKTRLGIRAAGFRTVAYFFETSLREAMERNDLRAGKQKVPAPAVAAAFKKLVPPTADERFDEIYTVKVVADGGFVVAKSYG